MEYKLFKNIISTPNENKDIDIEGENSLATIFNVIF
jgi:hypothetical protein